jgi:hypothetical protein
MDNPNAAATATLTHLVDGYRITQLIYVAAKLGLADLLVVGPQSSAELAAQTSTHAPALYRLLRALSSLGIFREEAPDRFALTALAQPLRTAVPGSVRGWAIFSGDPQSWLPWGDLAQTVTTGEPAFERIFGQDNWTYRAAHPEANAIFDAAMTSASRRDLAAILAAYDFGAFRTLVDVAGGQGALLAGILQAYPALRGILFDQPHVLDQARPLLEAAGVAERCAVVAGDFFGAVPPGGDAYLLRRIIHDWDDAPSVAILQQCRQAMPAAGTLLLIEAVIGPSNRADHATLSDINMLVALGGRERTAAEYADLLAAAGFTLTRIVPTAWRSSIIEAVPAAPSGE